MDRKLILRRLFKGFIALALLGALGLVTYQRATEDPPDIESIEDIERREGKSVVTANPREKRFDDYILADATLRAPRRYELRANLSEKVEKVMVDVGDVAESGDLLAEFRKDDIKSDIKAARTRLDEAQKNYERFQNLLERRVVSEDTVEARLTAMQEARSALQNAQSRLEFTEVRAPSGKDLDYGNGNVRVSARNVDPGEFKTAGQPLVTLTDMSVMDIEVQVPESRVKYLAPGLLIEFRLEQEEQWKPARVERISPETDDPHRFFTVYGRTDNVKYGSEWRLRSGMYAQVRISKDGTNPAMAIPTNALRITEDGCCSIFVVEAGEGRDSNTDCFPGIAREIRIETGLRAEDWVEVISPRLAGDEQVILSPRLDIRDGDRVKVMKQRQVSGTGAGSE